jgi:hypothetical protein
MKFSFFYYSRASVAGSLRFSQLSDQSFTGYDGRASSIAFDSPVDLAAHGNRGHHDEPGDENLDIDIAEKRRAKRDECVEGGCTASEEQRGGGRKGD